jgi:hypothetical protein
MRSIVLLSGVTALCVLAGCSSSTSNGSSDAGGTTDTLPSGGDNGAGGSGGAGGGAVTSSGGITAAGGTGAGNTSSGGTLSTGGTLASGGSIVAGGVATTGGRIGAGGSPAGGADPVSGGAPMTGGATASGGATVAGGRTGRGGTQATGGSTVAGGAPPTGGATVAGGAPTTGGTTGAGGGTGGTTASEYQGPCDVLPSGCAEAYGMARAMTAKYTGPLFQIGLAKDKTKTLDIAQTADHKADMSTWSDFCGGTQSNCVVSKIYGQIHPGPNDLLPAVWKAPWGPDCSAGGYTCAAKFTIESATSLPILTTDAPQEYALSGDNAATGVNGGKQAMGLMYNGKPVANTVYCCGVFGLAHKYSDPDTYGTDFMVALAYGWRDSGGCCIAVNCGASNKYCVGAEEEENNDLYDYGSSPIENAVVVTQFDPSKNAVISYLNGNQVLSHSPPKANLNSGTRIHIGGGGDLSQPDPVRMREAFVANAVMSASEVTALKANITGFFSTLNFPPPG